MLNIINKIEDEFINGIQRDKFPSNEEFTKIIDKIQFREEDPSNFYKFQQIGIGFGDASTLIVHAFTIKYFRIEILKITFFI